MDSYARAKLTQYNKSFKAIDETYRNVAKRFGMSECTFWILYTLRTEEFPMTQSEICSLQYQPKQTVNSALKKLESEGFINFSVGADRRSKYVILTEKGLQLAQNTVDVFAESEADALLDMTENEQNALCDLLEKYNHLLNIKLKTPNTKGDKKSMKIITVSREFGSGGREIAKRLSDVLGIAYYDSEIITEIAKKSDLDENYVANSLEKGIQPAFQIHFACAFSHISAPDPTVKLLAAQHDIINQIAEKGDCIIVGRAADVLLEKYDPFRIFVYADMESKIARCRKRAGESKLSDKEIEKKIKQIDKGRASSYNMISSTDWGDKRGYDLCVNTTNMNIKEITPFIAEYARQWFKDKQA